MSFWSLQNRLPTSILVVPPLLLEVGSVLRVCFPAGLFFEQLHAGFDVALDGLLLPAAVTRLALLVDSAARPRPDLELVGEMLPDLVERVASGPQLDHIEHELALLGVFNLDFN